MFSRLSISSISWLIPVSFSFLLLCILALPPVRPFAPLRHRYLASRRVYTLTFLSPVDLNCSTLPDFPVLWSLLTSHSSLLLRISPPVRPHGISRQSFLVYLPDLPTRVTFAFWTSLLLASSSAVQALVSGFCSSGYDFAIASSLPHLAM